MRRKVNTSFLTKKELSLVRNAQQNKRPYKKEFLMINSTILDSSSAANVQGKYVYDLLLFSLLDGSNYRLSILIDQNRQPGAGLLIVGT